MVGCRVGSSSLCLLGCGVLIVGVVSRFVVSCLVCPFVVVIRRCCLLVRVLCWLLVRVALRCCYVRLFVIYCRAYLLCVVDAVDLRRC